jgi:aminoglycoside phosphotransferase (APT) family kinase protein
MDVITLDLLDNHFGTEIYIAQANNGKFIIKTLPLHCGNLETEGRVTDYLLSRGIPVARILLTKSGKYSVETDTIHFHVQEFIEGITPPLNSLSDDLLDKLADTLGRIHGIMSDYDDLPTSFGKDFFDKNVPLEALVRYTEALGHVGNDEILSSELSRRIEHLKRILSFNIDTDKLTYGNSHGDFHVGQIIVDGDKLVVIDWTSASRVPLCLEAINSFVTAAPACRLGKIDAHGFKRYIERYSRHFTLTEYDLRSMPFVLYWQQLLCHYDPPYRDVVSSYRPVCTLINNFTDWLYDNAENLSEQCLTL